MKKIIIVAIVRIFILSGLGATGFRNTITKPPTSTTIDVGTRGTHTVLGEDGTATWRRYCPFDAGALK